MSGKYTMADRPIKLTTPLGTDALLATGLSGHEGISTLFHFHVDCLSPRDKAVAFDKLLGEPVTVSLELPGKKQRYFHGICNRVSQGESDDTFTEYRLDVVPQLWLLTRRAQSRIFQHKSVPDILKEVLKGFPAEFQIQGTFEPRDFCVQYRETDFNFASRLMEEEGIFYFFKHANGSHTLVVANTPGSHPELAPDAKLLLNTQVAIGDAKGGQPVVHDWSKSQEIITAKFTLWDHCFELPHKHLEADKKVPNDVQAGKVTMKLAPGNLAGLEIYDWPGEYAQRFDGVDKGGGDRPADIQKIYTDNKRTVEIRAQEEAARAITIHGSTDYRHLVSGHKFTLAALPGDKKSADLQADGAYVLTSVQHSARLNQNYRSGEPVQFEYLAGFRCIPAAVPFRPARVTPRPTVPGTQTAVVVGPQGEEIFTDKYGRVKVQFHWDREGKNNADSSCWVRVSQVWAGKRWGASFWPRIGQEVVVAFLEGDPDQPIIIGSVYNYDQMPPYLGDGPDGKHTRDNKVSGIKSNTTLGGQGYNEWRFDDTKDKEQIFIHAQRDMDQRVLRDRRDRTIMHQHVIVGYEKDGKRDGDLREQVHQDQHVTVMRNHVEHVWGNYQLQVGKGESSPPPPGNLDVVVEADHKRLVGGDDHLHIKKKQTTKIDDAEHVTIGSDSKTKVGGGMHLTVANDCLGKVGGVWSMNAGQSFLADAGQSARVNAGQEIHVKAGMTLVLEAGVQLSLKVGGNFIDIGPAGISIVGTLVMINSGGAAASSGLAKGADPQAPDAVVDATEARPTKPDVADDSKTGVKSSP